METTRFRVLMVDDHRLFMEGLALVLASMPEVDLMDTKTNGPEAIRFLESNSVDLVLMDYQMPEMDGLETVRAIRKKHPDQKVLLLSMHKNASLIRELMDLGGNGFVLKSADSEELMMAIRQVLKGGKYYSGELMEELVKDQIESKKSDSEPLTDRELEIISEICNGLSTLEIADKLFISPRTVETHRKNLMAKLEMKNIASLVRWGIQNGLG